MIAMSYGSVYVAQVALGGNDIQTLRGTPRGRGVAGAVADHRVLHLHRPRHRHADVDGPPEGGRAERVLAALPLHLAAAHEHPCSAWTPRKPTGGFEEFSKSEARFAMLRRKVIEHAGRPRRAAEGHIDSRRPRPAPEALAGVERTMRASRTRGRGARRRRTGRRRGHGGHRMSVDLRTEYLGLELGRPWSPRRPAHPTGGVAAGPRRCGRGAVVLPSLFEEQITAEAARVDDLLGHGDFFAEAESFFPDETRGPRRRTTTSPWSARPWRRCQCPSSRASTAPASAGVPTTTRPCSRRPVRTPSS